MSKKACTLVVNTEKTQKLQHFRNVEEAVNKLSPRFPLRCIMMAELKKNAKTFLNDFMGEPLYAVKSNPDEDVLKYLIANGIKAFDAASINEIKLIHSLLPTAKIAFMHPVKSRESIREAYFNYGVRIFVIDTLYEFEKIMAETNQANDLTIVTRIYMPKGSALCSLSGKFGILPGDAPKLIKATAKKASKVGISFHIGSQSMNPQSYAKAIKTAGDIIKQSGCKMSVFDIGGGFPIPYLIEETPNLTDFFSVIEKSIKKLKLPEDCEIWAEPGRALSGTGEILVVRVELRKDSRLYINDGSYGNMMEVNCMNWRNKCYIIRPDGRANPSKKLGEFDIYGSTCDSWDHLKGPFKLPANIEEGDWIVFYGQGAYGAASKTDFNGFKETTKVIID